MTQPITNDEVVSPDETTGSAFVGVHRNSSDAVAQTDSLRYIGFSPELYGDFRNDFFVQTSLTHIRSAFMQCFFDQGFRHEPSAAVSSNVDPTVLFVGSNISILKKYILNEIPSEGVVIDQPSMRFRELNQLFDPGYRPAYGAFFNELGAITRFADPERLAGLLWEYLSNGIGIAPNELIIRASSADDDLLRIAKRFFHSLELDSRPVGYYRHSIGEPGFCGRNFNIALKNRNSGDFQDIGNFLAFDRDGVGAFYEVALGDTVIQRALRGHDHVLHSYAVVAPALLNQIEGLNFINSITVATVLYREGLRASNRSNQERILSKYLRYMFMLHDHKGIGFDDIKKSVVSFEKLYFGNQSGVDQQIITDLEFKAPVFRKALRRAEISNAEQIE